MPGSDPHPHSDTYSNCNGDGYANGHTYGDGNGNVYGLAESDDHAQRNA
jgi:hypothetical protein